MISKANMMLCSACFWGAVLSLSAQNINPGSPTATGEVIQIDVKALLNSRVITTFTDGKLVPAAESVLPFKAELGQILTASAVKGLNFEGDMFLLPDDGRFAATDRYPEIVLNYRNDDATGMQVRRSERAEEYSFPVPAKKYSRMMIFVAPCGFTLTGYPLTYTLTYSDGTATSKTINVWQWAGVYKGKSPDPILGVVNEHSKYRSFDPKTREPGHHRILSIELNPDSSKTLVKVTIKKDEKTLSDWPKFKDQMKEYILTFFGATGVVAGTR